MANLPSDDSHQTSLLATKLYIPQTRHAAVVARPRLVQRLNEGLHCKLTLVAAPAGFGKTTLVSSWLLEIGEPRSGNAQSSQSPMTDDQSSIAAWLSLDEADNDPFRFWTYVIAALQTAQPDLGQTALAMLRAPQPPPIENLLTGLINQIAALSDRIVLVLDDYHLIETPDIDRSSGRGELRET
jgi:LuxR family maltose regulon positive regulatory protein